MNRVRPSVMHSPPVQPISSSSSGTGSVSTMCDEVTVRRERSGGERAPAAPTMERTAARQPHAPAVRLGDSRPELAHARAPEHPHAALDQPGAQP